MSVGEYVIDRGTSVHWSDEHLVESCRLKVQPRRVPLGLGMSTKVLHHSVISFIPKDDVISCFNNLVPS